VGFPNLAQLPVDIFRGRCGRGARPPTRPASPAQPPLKPRLREQARPVPRPPVGQDRWPPRTIACYGPLQQVLRSPRFGCCRRCRPRLMFTAGAGVLLSEAMNGAPQLSSGHHETRPIVLPVCYLYALSGFMPNSNKLCNVSHIGAWRSLVAHLPCGLILALPFTPAPRQNGRSQRGTMQSTLCGEWPIQRVSRWLKSHSPGCCINRQ
jgi:hypothetical protein